MTFGTKDEGWSEFIWFENGLIETIQIIILLITIFSSNLFSLTSSLESKFKFFINVKDTKGKKLIIKIDTQSLDELIISLIPDEIINNTVLLNYELTSVKGVKKQKISFKDFKSNISKLGDVNCR